MIQLRPHMEDIEESKKRVVHISDVDDVIAYIHCYFPQWRPDRKHLVQVHCGFDRRTGWDTWVIKLRSHPVLWTDGPIDGIQSLDVIGGKPG